MTSRGITYFLHGVKKRQKIANAPCSSQFLAFLSIINRPMKGMAEFLKNSQTLVRAFDIHSRKIPLTESRHTIDQGIEMVENVLQYVQACSQD